VRLLIEHFLTQKAMSYGKSSQRFTPEAMRLLTEYPWPGNVRELENTIEYALAVGNEEELGVDSLPLELCQARLEQNSLELKDLLEAFMTDSVPLAEIEKRYILSVLQHFGGNQVRAAAALGIDRSKLYRRLRQYGVRAVRFLQEEQMDGMQLRA
jgi:DNA-binding NtrC family response regulator